MTAQSLVLSKSEYERLMEEIRILKAQIASLMAEKDDLELHVCREIQADYDEKVGGLELEAEELKLKIQQLKRTIEYMQAVINQQKKADYEEAKKKTEEEYRQYEEDLHKRAEDIHNNEDYARRRAKQDRKNRKAAEEEFRRTDEKKNQTRSGAHKYQRDDTKRIGADTEEESAESERQESAEDPVSPDQELKRLYRKIVKRLHPDTNPNVTEHEKELLNEAMQAYADGDLERLQEIWDMIADGSEEEFSDSEEDLKRLRKLAERLREQKEILEYAIDHIKSTFPYIAKDFLADEVAVAARRKELKEFIEACKEEIARLEERLQELRSAA